MPGPQLRRRDPATRIWLFRSTSGFYSITPPVSPIAIYVLDALTLHGDATRSALAARTGASVASLGPSILELYKCRAIESAGFVGEGREREAIWRSA